MPNTPLIETELVDESGPPPRDSGSRSGSSDSSGNPAGASAGSGAEKANSVPGSASTRAAFHPMSVGLLLVVDNLWALADWVALSWFLTIPLSFLTVFFNWSAALLKALFLGAVAAVPTFVTGTTVGLALLAWAGIKRMRR